MRTQVPCNEQEEGMENQKIRDEIARQSEILQNGLDKCVQSIEKLKDILRDVPEIAAKHGEALAPDPDVKRPPNVKPDA